MQRKCDIWSCCARRHILFINHFIASPQTEQKKESQSKLNKETLTPRLPHRHLMISDDDQVPGYLRTCSRIRDERKGSGCEHWQPRLHSRYFRLLNSLPVNSSVSKCTGITNSIIHESRPSSIFCSRSAAAEKEQASCALFLVAPEDSLDGSVACVRSMMRVRLVEFAAYRFDSYGEFSSARGASKDGFAHTPTTVSTG